ncbi:ATP-dependent DNA helicase [Ideonella livida]|uniref:ATP-dependent DNA helicase n=1 Tax=Ideonella livida TaxID=2707176 RepID=UPI00287376C5|nr:ATP-dependent DNA helicase [Ideonella livida]
MSAEVELAFGPHGALARSDPAYEPRQEQVDLAQAIAQAIDRQETLVAEAGTGVGKTFAYLVPVLLSGRRALVSTATKNLQDQLFLRDLPRLRERLGRPVSCALLKGRGSYLCRHRLQQAHETAVLLDRRGQQMLTRIIGWAQQTRDGDMSDIDGLEQRPDVAGLVTSNRDNCLGSECPSYTQCHVLAARREAMAADVVVVNHHLFFADVALKETGAAELLPSVDVAVFDEAHQMVETGVQFLGVQLSSSQVLDLGQDVLAAGLGQARGLAPWQELCAGLELAVKRWRLAGQPARADAAAVGRLPWEEVQSLPDWSAATAALQQALDAVGGALQQHEEQSADLKRLAERCVELRQRAAMLETAVAPSRVRWLDVGAQHVRAVDSPLDIRALMAEQQAIGGKAWVFTSATLGDDEALSWFCESAGLGHARRLRLGSPFDYARNARVYVPARFPLPHEAAHPRMVGRAAAHCAKALSGRCFVLTTSLRVLQPVAEAMRDELVKLGADLEILVQGSASKRTLLDRFLAGRAVLVGSHSFWEGVDVPGDKLQCVFIDKLPFPSPKDPLVEARVRHLREQGRDPFMSYFVPEAAVALKQGAGRLIRTVQDQGLLVLCDTRLLSARYGRRLLECLPPMTALESGEDALSWLRTLDQGRMLKASDAEGS